jgi:hypothetical protein
VARPCIAEDSAQIMELRRLKRGKRVTMQLDLFRYPRQSQCRHTIVSPNCAALTLRCKTYFVSSFLPASR